MSTPKFIFIAALAAVALTGCSEKKTEGQPEVMPVSVAVPVIDSITIYKTYPGFLTSNNIVDVVCQVNGRLLSKNYASGDYVNKGQVLFTIEPTTYRDAVQQAEAALATAQSNYEYYTKQYDAMQRALAADAVSQMDVNQAKSNLDNAKAAISNAQAALETARTNLSHCTITAPQSGYITGAAYDPGNYLAGAGAPITLATIYDDSLMIASFSIEDSQYEKMAGDGKREVKVPISFAEKLPHEYEGTVYYIGVSVDKSTGTLPIKCHVENPYNELRNDMYITASLPVDTNPRAMLVRDASIGTDQAGKYLYVVNDSNKVVYTPIEVGDLYQDTLRVVTKGITPDTRYVTAALLKVRDGMTVKPVMK